MKRMLILILITLFVSSCKENNPVKPQNQSPVITSILVFPQTIEFTDSVLVVCNAIDPDGDTLVYDWITDSRLQIKGTNESSLYHTSENSHIFYPTKYTHTPIDTVWVQCAVRDVKGGADRRVVRITVKQNAERRE